MKAKNKDKNYELSLTLQIITVVAGFVITSAFLVFEPSLKAISECISVKGLWIYGMVILASSSLLGIINKHRSFSQKMTVVSLVLLVTLLLKEIL